MTRAYPNLALPEPETQPQPQPGTLLGFLLVLRVMIGVMKAGQTYYGLHLLGLYLLALGLYLLGLCLLLYLSLRWGRSCLQARAGG